MEGLCHDKHDELWHALWLTGPARPLCERWKILGWNGQGDRVWRWIILSHIFPWCLVHLEWRGVVKLWVLEFCFLLRISIWKWLRKSRRLRTFTSFNLADFCWQGSLCKPLVYELGGWSKCCRSTHAATIKLFAEFWVAKTGQEHPGKSVQNPVTFWAPTDCLLRSLVSSTAHGKEGRGAQVQTFLRAFKDLRFDHVLWLWSTWISLHNRCSVTRGFEQTELVESKSWFEQVRLRMCHSIPAP